MKTMLDKVVVAGDISQAMDRLGCYTAAICVIGGTSETAVKVVTCDTADGQFEDFKTLIPAASASASQYKGFVVDLTGSKKFVKVTGAQMCTAVLGDCDYDVKQITFKTGDVPSQKVIEKKVTATIDVSTYTEAVSIKPSAGKDAMEEVVVTLSNIPEGE